MGRENFIFPKDPSPDVSYLDDGTKRAHGKVGFLGPAFVNEETGV
ncbi:MAG: hypothetical protein ACOX69_03355 [Coriobacteriales bacterium]